MHIYNIINNIENTNKYNLKKHKYPFKLFKSIVQNNPNFNKNQQIILLEYLIKKYNSLNYEIVSLKNNCMVSNTLIPIHARKTSFHNKNTMYNKFPPRIRITGGFLQ